MGVIEALFLAFLGGIVLNVMPCVLPVLAVKLTSLASIGGQDRGRALRHAAGYTSGITASMLVLAAAVVALKSLGIAVGWGFQLQHPRFVAGVGAVFVLFALNLFEVYRIPALATTGGSTEASSDFGRSFFEGIVAVLVSTPCSAPFMAAAVGFALTAGAMTIVGVLVALGLGLASPFVAVALVPGARRLLPDPGAWMVTVERVLGFVLLGAALWLVWLYGRLTGLWGVTTYLGFLLAVAFGFWGIGRLQPLRGNTARIVGAVLFVALPVSVGAWTFAGPLPAGEARGMSDRTEPRGDAEIDWGTWSEARVERELRAGRPVFVDFTADWCISCKVNEREVLSDRRVRRAARRNDVAMLKGDMTEPDDAILAKLEEFGRAGVPLYLLYDPEERGEPRVLAQQLEIDSVVEAFDEVGSRVPD